MTSSGTTAGASAGVPGEGGLEQWERWGSRLRLRSINAVVGLLGIGLPCGFAGLACIAADQWISAFFFEWTMATLTHNWAVSTLRSDETGLSIRTLRCAWRHIPWTAVGSFEVKPARAFGPWWNVVAITSTGPVPLRGTFGPRGRANRDLQVLESIHLRRTASGSQGR